MIKPENLRLGQEVEITFRGVVADADHGSVRFKHPDGLFLPITWSDRLTPKIEIIGPVYQRGDVGVYENHGGAHTVVYRPEETLHGLGSRTSRPAGWYSSANAPYGLLAPPDSPRVTLIIRADGTMVEN